MAEKRIIEYEAASELANDDWLLIDGVTEGTRKARPSTVTAELGEQVTNIATAVGGLTQVAMGHEQSFAPSYDESTSYDVGDLVMQYHSLYKCTAATTGAWDAGKWARTEVSEQLEESGKIDDVQVNGVSVVTDKVASIDLTDMQADIDSKQADTQLGGTSILDNNKVANLDFLASYGEASGEIASFNDGAAMPLKSLKVGIEATQDLHGYDYPWPAGGGKNKLNNSKKIYVDYKIYVGTNIADGVCCTLKAGTYTISAKNRIAGNLNTYIVDKATGNYIGGFPAYGTISNTFTLSEQKSLVVYFYNTLYTSTDDVYDVQIEEGSQATTYAPYSNECPIEGHTEANVNKSGVNVWDEEWVLDGNYRLSSKNYIPVKANTEYLFCNTLLYSITCYDINKNSLGGVSLTQVPTIGYKFTTKPNTYFIKFNVGNSYGTTYNNDISINYPSTDTSYHAYNGQTYTIDLDGTRYGCTLDVVSGVLTVDRAYVDLGDLNWAITVSTNTNLYVSIPNLRYNGAICSIYKIYPEMSIGSQPLDTMQIRDTGMIYVRSNSYSDADTFKTAMAGQKLVYELATPQTIQLTPTAVKSLLGTNNLWADCGEIIECKYVRDNSLVINDLIARVTALENA